MGSQVIPVSICLVPLRASALEPEPPEPDSLLGGVVGNKGIDRGYTMGSIETMEENMEFTIQGLGFRAQGW